MTWVRAWIFKLIKIRIVHSIIKLLLCQPFCLCACSPAKTRDLARNQDLASRQLVRRYSSHWLARLPSVVPVIQPLHAHYLGYRADVTHVTVRSSENSAAGLPERPYQSRCGFPQRAWKSRHQHQHSNQVCLAHPEQKHSALTLIRHI